MCMEDLFSLIKYEGGGKKARDMRIEFRKSGSRSR